MAGDSITSMCLGVILHNCGTVSGDSVTHQCVLMCFSITSTVTGNSITAMILGLILQ